jgi:TetR/AcrR family transcriptional regulator, transcriptional repressor for nem operon
LDFEVRTMRASREVAAASKARIVSEASKMLRERGVEATSVADVMHAAGMTHGGFYKHFAARRAFDDVAERFDRREKRDGVELAIAAYRRDYLTQTHVEEPGRGCPLASLAADAGRTEALAPAFADGVEKLVQRFSRSADEAGGARAQSLRDLTMLVGAVVVARAVGAGPLRDEILAACTPRRP